MQYGFFFDQSRCIGCNACTVSCKDWYQVNPGPVRWRNQQNYENGKSVFENLSMACNHCAEPACVTACGVNAISKTDKGMVIVDRSKCTGLLSCVTACPFSSPHIALDKQEPAKRESWQIDHPMQKCNYCWERVNDGERPVCVAACPVHALDYGDMEELRWRHPEAVQLNKEDFPYAFSNDTDTKPSFLIKKRKDIDIVYIK